MVCAVASPLLAAPEAQPDSVAPPAAAVDAPATAGKESNQGVFVRDSAGALEKLNLADRMERLKQWDTAADVLQEIVEKYPDRVVPSKTDGQNRIVKYTSVTLAVQERLSRWPADGLAAYNARFGPVAQNLLDGTARGDVSGLHKVFALYFPTDAGKAAGLRLVDAYLESGEFAAAAWLGDRLLALHPNLRAERPEVLFRTATAYHLAGDDGQTGRLADELKRSNATGKIRGQDAPLGEAIQQVLSTPRPETRAASPEAWPTFMGDAARSRVSTGTGKPGARAFVSIDLPRPYAGRAAMQLRLQQQRQQAANDVAQIEAGMLLGIMPAVDNGELFFNDGSRLYAVSLETSLPLPGWNETYPGDKQGRYLACAPFEITGNQYAVTLTEDRVLAVMGRPDRTRALQAQFGVVQQLQRMGASSTPDETRLVCVDRKSGREVWVAQPSKLADEGNLRSLNLDGSPVVVGNNVYVLGRGGKSVQFEDCYVLCFDLETGKHRWSCYVASANTGAVGFGGGVAGPSNTSSHLAYSGGRLYVLSNVGAVASVDAYAGSVVWLSLYPRSADEQAAVPWRAAGAGVTPAAKPWTFNAAVVDSGKVFALPTDAQHVLVYDAATGDELKRLNLQDFANPDMLLAVQGNRMLFGSEYKIWCVDWTRYNPETFTQRDPSIFWPREFKSSPIRGRPFVTRDAVYVPTKSRLYRVDMRYGKAVDEYPPVSRPGWDDDNGAGNVLVTGDKVVVAASRKVDVYTDIAVARAKVEADIAREPNSADHRLRYADMLFVSGDADGALARIDDAIQLLGGAGNLKPGADRNRVFTSAMTFANKLATASTGVPPAATIAAYYDRAATAADGPAQQALYRSARARFALDNQDPAAAVKLYQEILADESLRRVPVPQEDSTGSAAGVPAGSIAAGKLAERAIAAVVRAPGGAKWYEPYEQQARQALDFARGKPDPGELLAIAQRFPNSSAALPATLAAAAAFEAGGNSRQAARLLRQAIYQFPEVQQPKLLEAIARNSLAANPPRVDVAASRLAAAANSGPANARLSSTLKLPDGTVLENVTYEQAAEALRAYRAKANDVVLPTFRFPQPGPRAQQQQPNAGRPATRPAVATPFAGPAGGEVIENIDAMVPPLPGYARPDRLVTWTRAPKPALSVIRSPEARLAAVNNLVGEQAVGCAWLRGGAPDTLLTWTKRRVILLRAGERDLRAVWQLDLSSLPDVDVVTPDASVEADGVAAAGGQIDDFGGGVIPFQPNQPVIIRGDARAAVFINGRLIPLAGLGNAQAQQQGPAGQAPGADEFITAVRPAGDRILVATSTGRLAAIDLAEGRLAWQTRLASAAPLDRLEANEDYCVARVTDPASGSQLVAADVFTGQVIYRATFPAEGGQFPQNLVLSPGGILVWTLPNQLCGKDLNDPAPRLAFSSANPSDPTPLYLNMTDPDQLLTLDDKVFAVCQNGQHVRVFSLDTGRPLRTKAPGNDKKEDDLVLSTGAPAGRLVRLVSAKPYVYAVGETTLQAYNVNALLKGPAASERTVPADASIRDAFPGNDYLVLFDRPGQRLRGADLQNLVPGQPAPQLQPPANPQRALTCRILAYRRSPAPSGESGLLDYATPIREPAAAIQSCLPAEGGIYYLTADRKLHFLRAAGAQ